MNHRLIGTLIRRVLATFSLVFAMFVITYPQRYVPDVLWVIALVLTFLALCILDVPNDDSPPP